MFSLDTHFNITKEMFSALTVTKKYMWGGGRYLQNYFMLLSFIKYISENDS